MAVELDHGAPRVQADRLRAVEPRLAEVPLTRPSGEPRIAYGSGHAYAAVGWTVRRLSEDDPSRAWTPDVSAAAGPLALPTEDTADAATASRRMLDSWASAVAETDADAVLTVLWPTADGWARRWLAGGGFTPRVTLAVRPPGGLPSVRADAASTASVRRGRPDDLDAVAAMHREEAVYHADLEPGGRVLEVEQQAARDRMAAGLRGEGGSVTHLVEADGRVVAACESWPADIAAFREGAQNAWLSEVLPPGGYVYVNTVCVTAAYRGRGFGALLMRDVLRDLGEQAPDGTYLWYSDLNPISPGFWQKMGYRPLWTRYHRDLGGAP